MENLCAVTLLLLSALSVPVVTVLSLSAEISVEEVLPKIDKISEIQTYPELISSWIEFRRGETNRRETMKVHPAPKQRNITVRYEAASPLNEANGLLCGQKKLRRLPHIFAKVLELPFFSDADVSIDETDEFLRFTVSDTDVCDDVCADTIEIYPGVTKIVVRSNDVLHLSIDELGLDLCRFRLPASTRPELATASYVDGDLVVIVPKGADGEGGDEGEGEQECNMKLFFEYHLVPASLQFGMIFGSITGCLLKFL
ncbi:hypothetical protein Nepgr_029798 [Nepenthes gracilis]|uniref:SHSP domain-containing protein n=1 Tax=Nepenthes gracilis TaxID=150966 RepID=A0AAD3TEB5_NEPGR|nr:hypothetical protein Nepgr_029798 [Nepenthes gracilis]